MNAMYPPILAKFVLWFSAICVLMVATGVTFALHIEGTSDVCIVSSLLELELEEELRTDTFDAEVIAEAFVPFGVEFVQGELPIVGLVASQTHVSGPVSLRGPPHLLFI